VVILEFCPAFCFFVQPVEVLPTGELGNLAQEIGDFLDFVQLSTKLSPT